MTAKWFTATADTANGLSAEDSTHSSSGEDLPSRVMLCYIVDFFSNIEFRLFLRMMSCLLRCVKTLCSF